MSATACASARSSASRTGTTHRPSRPFEAAEAIPRNGADEVDIVINLAMVKDGCWDDVAADIRAVREVNRGRILKVIIECCLLTEEEKRMLCRIVSDSGADYIKTSPPAFPPAAPRRTMCACAPAARRT